MKVLICDDSKFMRTIIKNNLKKIDENIEIIGEASNGEESIKKYKELKPDFVTLDVVMDNKNGEEVLKEIMQYDKGAKIIMVSSMGQEPIILNTIKDGAIDFVVKPFSMDSLSKSITMLKYRLRK